MYPRGRGERGAQAGYEEGYYMDQGNYWARWNSRRLTRRRLLGTAGATSSGLAALAVVGCGGDDDDDNSERTNTPQSTPAKPGVATETATTDTEARRGGTLRNGTYLNTISIDPHVETSAGLAITNKIYTFLGAFNTIDSTFHPMLAENVEQASDTEYIFHIRKGVKFHDVAPVDGREVTAEDVVYSYERFRDLPNAQGNDFFKQFVDKMEAVDSHTFKLTTNAPYADTFTVLGASNGFGVQAAIVAKEDVEARGDLSNGGIGAGPFILDTYVKGERTLLKRNPDYWDPNLPYLDEWSTQIILDQQTLLQAYKSGQLDIQSATITKLDFADLERNDNFISSKQAANYYASLGMNVSKEPFNDPRVREAIYIGIERKQFIDKVFQGEAAPMGVFSNGLAFWALPQEEIAPYVTTDVQKAKELLSAAGYPDGFDLDIDTSNGVKLMQDHAEILVSELRKLGINANLKIGELGAVLSTKLYKGDFDAIVFAHNPNETLRRPIAMYHKNGVGAGSWWHYDNPEVTDAIDRQAQELDVQKRQQIVYEMQRLALADWAPMLNFATPTQFVSYNKRLGGYDPSLRGFQGLRYTEYIKE